MINFSENASEKIRELLSSDNNPNILLRVGVKEGGCSGFSYGMGTDDKINEGDQVYEHEGFKVVVDPESILHIDGLVVDFKESIMGGGFTMDNPNAVASCGCGASFRTRTSKGNAEKCE
ncbi:HesB/IscA family protein [Brevibacillus daliensis]|uniref:HesB/IscA family protein n=1 Tax=Brevibacillus daliensis TaxID=2892995 RepID=UPI001E54342C|nr:iron-sulfur cluster assembly accessory protein [Brevibacillus daliensis]